MSDLTRATYQSQNIWGTMSSKRALFVMLIVGTCIVWSVILTVNNGTGHRTPLFDVPYPLNISRQKNSEKEEEKEIPRFFSYLDKGPLNFSTNFKNPCWYDKDNLYCLPYFYVAGFPKSGTTDLHIRISSHRFYVKAKRKEPHWMTRHRFKGKEDPSSRLLSYTNYFMRITNVLKDSNTTAKERLTVITGDCSASTAWDNDHWRLLPGNQGFSEPRYTTSDIVKQLNPDTKIIIILRNPISRLYSDYLYFHKKGKKSAEEFHMRVLTGVKIYQNCTKFHSLRHCLYDSNTSRQSLVRIRIGVYQAYLAEWLRVFPRKQLFVLKLEEYSPAPEVKMREVFKFLGLDPMEISELVPMEKHANANNKTAYVGPMLNKTRKLLYEFYKPHNIKLAHLLKDERFNYGPI